MLFAARLHATQCRDFIRSAHARQAQVPCDDVPVRIVTSCIMEQRSADDTRDCAAASPTSSVMLHVVLFPTDCFPFAKQFWQHAGLGISSRMADECLRIIDHNDILLAPHSLPRRRSSAARVPLAGSAQPRGGGFGRSRYQRGTELEYAQSTPSVDDEELTHEQASFVEERYGRNLPFALAKQAKVALRRRIAGTLTGDSTDLPDKEATHSARQVRGLCADDVYLFPSGMASIFHAHQALMLERAWTQQGMTLSPASCAAALAQMKDPSFAQGSHGIGATVCFGFPYTDTLKVLQKWGGGCHFFGRGTDDELDQLEALLASQSEPRIHALFCEFPSNPLLRSADLPRLRRLADQHDFSIVIDETVGNFVNVEVLPYADIVVSSLTKVFSGDCNVMGGSLVLNPESRRYQNLQAVLSALYTDTQWVEDAIFLERNSRDFIKRIATIDQNALAVAEYLRAHSQAGGQAHSVATDVFYPKFVTRKHYETCRRTQPYADHEPQETQTGFGGLFSLDFVTQAAARAFYDTLQCAKGPSLGTNCTLACPYTLLAHYTELDWAEGMEVRTNLIRVSVGLEPTDTLLRVFAAALDAAQATAL